jgi:hypothetical protein
LHGAELGQKEARRAEAGLFSEIGLRTEWNVDPVLFSWTLHTGTVEQVL